MRFLPILLLFCHVLTAQVTSSQQKALNAYVDYANQSSKEVTLVVQSLKTYYEAIHQDKKYAPIRYACPVQPDDYYFENAQKLGKSLSSADGINNHLIALRKAAEAIDEKCKAVDTYHKLEGYKQDNYAKGDALVRDVAPLLKLYHEKQKALESALEAEFKKMHSSTLASYVKADDFMRKQMKHERQLLDSLSTNFREGVHTGFPVGFLSNDILLTDDHLKQLKQTTASLKYPASSMWTSFQESLASVLEEKRRALDEYNFEAKKSDKHRNETYHNLINYYNGLLVSNYNTFIQFAERDGYYGLKCLEYTPQFEIQDQALKKAIAVKPFEEIKAPSFSLPTQTTPISKPIFESLSNYVEFIDETWREVRYMQMVLTSFSSSASYYRNLDNYERRAPLHFDYQEYEVPLSYHQKAIATSKVLPSEVSKSFNAQATTLLNILKEIDDHAASIDSDVESRVYESDHLDKIYYHLDRLQTLINIWDERKESLYNDVRKVFDNYPSNQKTNSWFVSGNSLRGLAELDHEALFTAKKFYKGDSSIAINTLSIETALRDVISKEYANMKGIEKYGRNNGLCPYTPYEDLPQNSKTFVEKLQKIRRTTSSTQRHPYNDLVYMYNVIVDDYNKFAALSKDVPLLKTIHQPEFFQLKHLDSPQKNVVARSMQSNIQQASALTNNQPANPSSSSSEKHSAAVKVIRDTVYIEKRDTVYLRETDKDFRSMEGYATNNMVLLLDVSGSMNTEEKLPLLKESVLNMLSMMRQEDEVAVVTFSGKANLLLKPVSFKEEQRIRKAINNLKSSGKTDAAAGLELAYKVADGNYIRGGNNRIILATDGEFPIDDKTQELISDFAGQDIYLTIFYFGKGAGTAKTLENLSAMGNGNFKTISKENIEVSLIREAKSKKKAGN
jgi:Ca-activated chloride channel homolog